jgi:hypothetical protein
MPSVLALGLMFPGACTTEAGPANTDQNAAGAAGSPLQPGTGGGGGNPEGPLETGGVGGAGGVGGLGGQAGAMPDMLPDGGMPPETDQPIVVKPAVPCNIDTGHPGDDACIMPPAEGEGFQLHLGPDSYDPVAVEPYLLDPGVESTACVYVRTPNEATRLYYERRLHMRPVSHHVNVFAVAEDVVPAGAIGDTWRPCGDFTDILGAIGFGVKPITEYPAGGRYAPENEGIGRAITAKQAVKLELHAINTGNEPVLREMWFNVYYKPKEQITETVVDVSMMGGLSYATPPGGHEIMRNEFKTTGGPARILDLYGHAHASMLRFTAWRIRGAEQLLLFEDYDWAEPRVFNYDTLTTNLPPDRAKLVPGGHSGVLEFAAGDTIRWECEVLNTSNSTLRYRNSVYEGEMCNMFGEFVGQGGGIHNVWRDGVASPAP